MKLERYFVDNSLDVGKSVKLIDDQAKHCRTVMRNKPGDCVLLFNGLGGEFVAEIKTVSKTDIDLEVLEFNDVNRIPLTKILLFTAVPRHKRFDFLIEKATELGVSEIIPLITNRSANAESVMSETKSSRHKTKIIEACKQCGRNVLPVIQSSSPLDSMLTVDADLKIVLLPNSASFNVSTTAGKNSTIALAVGPEGGFTNNEVHLLIKNGWQNLTIGKSVLRVETAAISALSIVNHILDENS